MSREEIRNKIFHHLKGTVLWLETTPNKTQQLQIGEIYSLFPNNGAPHWQHEKIESIAREIIQELENNGYIYEGQAGGMGSMAHYPWFTISEFGKESLKSEDWLPYDPEGYVKSLQQKIPNLDQITLTYVQESIVAYNRRNLLSATITLGVASESLMLTLIETYANWIQDDGRRKRFKKNTENQMISKQYKEFKKEIVLDLGSFSNDLRKDWEIYLDGIFNFIRLNRNDAGHPTGKQLDAKITYANLQVFSEYAAYVANLLAFLR